MIHQGEELKKIVREKGITDEDFAKLLEITRGGVLDIYKRSRIKHKQLKEIVHVLNINYAQFLDDDTVIISASASEQAGNDYTKDLYERLLAEKERIIKEKDAHIEDLRKMLFMQEKR